jgi:hypothetical protein
LKLHQIISIRQLFSTEGEKNPITTLTTPLIVTQTLKHFF